jgi:formiminotetrahydrofolate cyclodeaminase
MKKTAAVSIGDYCSALAGKQPVPGGGSVNAVYGAVGCSLALMVIAYTLGKKKYERFTGELTGAKAVFKRLQRKFLILSDKDQESYAAYAAGGKKRAAAVKKMISVPLQVMFSASEALEQLALLRDKTNPWLRTDFVIAVDSLLLAFRASSMNVDGNCVFCEDQVYVDTVRRDWSVLRGTVARIEKKLKK